jgi:hypothetical protein
MTVATSETLTGAACHSPTECVAVGGDFPYGTKGVIMTNGK